MMKLTVVKIGGKVIDDPEKLNTFLDAFAEIATPKVLVHGGGTLATKLAEKMNIQTQMIEGRRVTDADNLDVVTMVYAGLVNKRIVVGLQSKGMDSIGICGADLNLIEAVERNHPTIDYGFVGDIKKVNTQTLNELLENDKVVVVSPITHDGNGQLLNTNADTVATELAVALCSNFQVKMIYSFEKNGVLLDPDQETSLIQKLNLDDLERYKNCGVIKNGMLPKTQNAFYAFEKGVKEVVIGDLVAMQSQGVSGTSIVGEMKKKEVEYAFG